VRILDAELEHFRNFASARLRPSPEVTAIVGDNGQGKTNAIEALFLVSALRPLRPVPRRALIREGERRARVSIRVERATTGLEHALELRLEGHGRALVRDDKKVSATDFIGSLVCVSFTPDDLQLAKAGPDGRRKFLDRALLNARPSYLATALRYAKAMKDRNKLLARDASDEELDAFDAILASTGARIVAARRAYVDRIGALVSARFDDIARPAPRLELRYASSLLGDPSEMEGRLFDELGARRARDRQRATTSVGPHLDDLQLTLGGGTAKERASQGQHRALVLALKLVEIEELASELGEAPVLLLDDMSSELDAGRTRQLFEAVRRLDGQVILTSTSPPDALAPALGGPRDFRFQTVRGGTLAPPEHLPTGESPGPRRDST
jgi:DNA replication and repair protein RecF